MNNRSRTVLGSPVWAWKLARAPRPSCSPSLRRCWLERAAGAPDAGRLQPHRGLCAAAGRKDHQPLLLGLKDSRAPKPALSGPQQHRALYSALAHQPRLHDVQWWLQGAVLVPEIHHRLEPSSLGFSPEDPGPLPVVPSPASAASLCPLWQSDCHLYVLLGFVQKNLFLPWCRIMVEKVGSHRSVRFCIRWLLQCDFHWFCRYRTCHFSWILIIWRKIEH